MKELVKRVAVYVRDDETEREFVDVVKNAYASGLANGYKDALIEEMEK
ncbi:hypothetical protein [Lactococcus allomyrinae]|nr:hypothetical protein [Lactococcus allomyrinae]